MTLSSGLSGTGASLKRGQKAPDGRPNYTYVVEPETEPEIDGGAAALT